MDDNNNFKIGLTEEEPVLQRIDLTPYFGLICHGRVTSEPVRSGGKFSELNRRKTTSQAPAQRIMKYTAGINEHSLSKTDEIMNYKAFIGNR